MAEKSGYKKILGACRLAKADDFKWLWVDTNCIDKTSSAELSEAINSMYEWYRRAKVCYAYLSDVPGPKGLPESLDMFKRSRWFTRGWTLQELLAPPKIKFYGASWIFLGTTDKGIMEWSPFNRLLSDITGIPLGYLDGSFLMSSASVAQRMSWAARRETTRVEDRAYSLLGIFGVNMPMLYGEGERAFLRLQEEIIKNSADQSIFAWGFGQPTGALDGLLARSPSEFQSCRDVIAYTPIGVETDHYSMTNMGLHLRMRMRRLPTTERTYLGVLNCTTEKELKSRGFKEIRVIAVPLTLMRRENGTVSSLGPYLTAGSSAAILVSPSAFGTAQEDMPGPVYISRGLKLLSLIPWPGLRVYVPRDHELVSPKVVEIYPPKWYPILNNGAGRFEESTGGEERIYIRFKLGGEDFALRLQYSYQLKRYVNGPGYLDPKDLKYGAACLRGPGSLAERIMEGDVPGSPAPIQRIEQWLPEIELTGATCTLSSKTKMTTVESTGAKTPYILLTVSIRSKR
ncbi:hypothetical protein QBC47DRAFT_391778 [Echria macrotheca]|uniref:Heterokaryon incompatibility domain-containing protein n=1 Tax=Echria macrotheca TaxID=438768 RepID=A0AAJ0B6Q8_9PEZI|nr:hypothetical protein QBC47DRAFT_391778 [Echria macrotheca]